MPGSTKSQLEPSFAIDKYLALSLAAVGVTVAADVAGLVVVRVVVVVAA